MTGLIDVVTEVQEKPVAAWISDIETCWKDIPEFRVDPEKLRHLAIICDGNRRAAKERGFNPYFGHRAGIEVIRGITRAARGWEVQTLSFWVWSTENWKREIQQVDYVMKLVERFLPQQELLDELRNNRVRFTHLGRKDRLPKGVRQTLENLEEQTKGFDRCRVNLALDYGGLDETARMIQRILDAIQERRFDSSILQTAPQAILTFLDTAEQALPDLVIRTGVERDELPHTSGFMPLQTTYSSWVFRPDLFPDLTPAMLLESICNYQESKRRFGR